MRAGVLVVPLAFLLCGAAAGAPTAAATTPQPLIGAAFAAGPLTGARVTVLGPNGRTIATASQTTLASGGYFVMLDPRYRDFTVVVRGGADEGVAFRGELRAVVRDHLPFASVDVTPATTVAAEVMRAGHRSKMTADKLVRRALGLPHRLSLGHDVTASESAFSTRTFEERASAEGGHDAYVRTVARRILAGESFSFERAAVGLGAAGDAGGSLADNLFARLLLSAAGQAAVGAIAYQLGLPTPDSKLMAQLQEIQQTLAAIKAELDQINSKLALLIAKVDKLQYALDVRPLQNLGSDLQLDTIWQDYHQLVSDGAAANGSNPNVVADIAAFQGAVESIRRDGATHAPLPGASFDALVKALHDVDDAMVGAMNTSSALTDWTTWRLDVAGRYWTSASQANLLFPYLYWSDVEAELATIIQEYVSLKQSPSFTAPGDFAGFLGPMQDSTVFKAWRTAGHLDGMIAIPDGYLVDLGTNEAWPLDWATVGPRIQEYQAALAAIARYNAAATFLPGSWTMPANVDFVALVSPSGGFPDQWSGASIAGWLAGATGIKNIWTYWWISDSKPNWVTNKDNITTQDGINRYEFSMEDGRVPMACQADDAASGCTTGDPVNVVAVAKLAAPTCTSWYGLPASCLSSQARKSR